MDSGSASPDGLLAVHRALVSLWQRFTELVTGSTPLHKQKGLGTEAGRHAVRQRWSAPHGRQTMSITRVDNHEVSAQRAE